MIRYCERRDLSFEAMLELYRINDWSAADEPDKLYKGFLNSHTLITAWDEERLVGLGNAISDGYLVVYYPHLLVHPDYQRQGIGKELMRRLANRYTGFHQRILVAEKEAIGFYEKCGLVRAGEKVPMSLRKGNG